MANDTVPMPEMFDACYRVLSKELAPIHYATLTKLALESLGLSEQDIHWQRQIEDVREKMLLAGYQDAFYIGQPYCLAGLRWWFYTGQARLFHPTQGIIIPGNASSGIKGAFEALMRNGEMITKTSASYGQIAIARARGLVLENHVADWFELNWPEFFLPPDNKAKWQLPCPHDFKLKVDSQTYEVDVSGPRSNGTYGNPGKGKRRVHFHLVCDVIGRDILWKSAVTGSRFNGSIHPDSDGIYPEKMIVWLNCKKYGVDYDRIKQVLGGTLAQITKAA